MQLLNITNKEYRDINAISNGELQQIEVSPSDYKWNKDAPQDESKTAAFDYGTALHAGLLEPETFNNIVDIYTDTKTRETVKFAKYLEEKPDDGKLVLLEAEYTKMRFTIDGAQYHPQFAKLIETATHKEASIVTEYRGIKCKVRPDAMRVVDGVIEWIGDVKSTADISDWRNSAEWRNPLFVHSYGFTAAFYMDVLATAFNCQVDEYKFLVVQKSVNAGRYPVAVFTITREELERYGFFDRVYNAIDTYKVCVETDNFLGEEVFPIFNSKFGDEIIISEEE